MSADNFLVRSRSISSIRKLLPNYRKAISQQSCDKYGLKFNGDDRFSLFKLNLNLSGYLGYYGNSGCSTFGEIGDKKLFEDAFVRYLNLNMESILNAVADEIEAGLESDKMAYLEKLRAEIARVEGGEG